MGLSDVEKQSTIFTKDSGASICHGSGSGSDNEKENLDPCCRQILQQLEESHRVALKYFEQRDKEGDCKGNCKTKVLEKATNFLKQLNISTTRDGTSDHNNASKPIEDEDEDIYTSITVAQPMDSILVVENCKGGANVKDSDDAFLSDNETTVKRTYTIDGELENRPHIPRRTRRRTLSGSNKVLCQCQSCGTPDSDCGASCRARKGLTAPTFFQRQTSVNSYLIDDLKVSEDHCCCEVQKMCHKGCQTDRNISYVNEQCQTVEEIVTSVQNETKRSESDMGSDNGSNNENDDETLLRSLGAMCDGDGQPGNRTMPQQMSSVQGLAATAEFKGARPKHPQNLPDISQMENMSQKTFPGGKLISGQASQSNTTGPMSLNFSVSGEKTFASTVLTHSNEDRSISLPEKSNPFDVDHDANRYKSLPFLSLQSMGYQRPPSPMSPKFVEGYFQSGSTDSAQTNRQKNFSQNLSLSEGSYPKKAPFSSFNTRLPGGTQNRVGRRSPNRHPSVKPPSMNKDTKLPGTTSLSSDNTPSNKQDKFTFNPDKGPDLSFGASQVPQDLLNKHSIFGPSHFKFGASDPEPSSNSQDTGSLIPKSKVIKPAQPLTNIENLTLPPPQIDNAKFGNRESNTVHEIIMSSSVDSGVDLHGGNLTDGLSQDTGCLIPKSNVSKPAETLTNIENSTLPPPQTDNAKVDNREGNTVRNEPEQIVLSSDPAGEISPQGSLTGGLSPEVQTDGGLAPFSAQTGIDNTTKNNNPDLVKPSASDKVPSVGNITKSDDTAQRPEPNSTHEQRSISNEPTLIPRGQHSYTSTGPQDNTSTTTTDNREEPLADDRAITTQQDELGAVGGVDIENVANTPALSENIKNRPKLKARRTQTNKNSPQTQGNDNATSAHANANAPASPLSSNDKAGNTNIGNIKAENEAIANLEADGANATNENTDSVENDNETRNETREATASNIVESESESDGDTDSSDDSDEELDIEEIRKQNIHLKSAKQCRVCRDNDANKLFLPCGHLACCSLCAPALQKCPQCKTVIRGIVAVYFG